jgi:hypothetical protein
MNCLETVSRHARDIDVLVPSSTVHAVPQVSLNDEVLSAFRDRPLQRVSLSIDHCAEYFSLRLFRSYPSIRKIKCSTMPVTSLVGLRLLPNLEELSLLVQPEILLALEPHAGRRASKHSGLDMLK